MKTIILMALMAGGMAEASELLYSNSTTDTFDTLFYSQGYAGLGDLIQLAAPGTANLAGVEFYNDGGAGTFDAELSLYNVGSPVGSLIGTYDVTGISTQGNDVLDVTFNLGGVVVPQNLVFVVSLNNVSQGVDPGVDFFEPPTVGSSDNTFMIASTTPGSYFELTTSNENVYFDLEGDADLSPEPGTVAMMGLGLGAVGWFKLRRRTR